jgi:primosomal replication protein N
VVAAQHQLAHLLKGLRKVVWLRLDVIVSGYKVAELTEELSSSGLWLGTVVLVAIKG